MRGTICEVLSFRLTYLNALILNLSIDLLNANATVSDTNTENVVQA